MECFGDPPYKRKLIDLLGEVENVLLSYLKMSKEFQMKTKIEITQKIKDKIYEICFF